MKKNNKKKIIKISILLICIGVFVCFIGMATAKFDVRLFYENGDHVWYRTVRLDEPFMFGIGE